MNFSWLNELELARLLNQNIGHRFELRELSFTDDSVGLALDRFLNDYLLQNELSDDNNLSESEIIEEESEDDCNSRVIDATTAPDLAETHLAVIVVETENSTMTEFAKVIT